MTREELIAFETDIAAEDSDASKAMTGKSDCFGVIYLVTNKINGKQYVGQTTKKIPLYRWKAHVSISRKAKSPLYRSLRKYGEDAFTFVVIWSAPDKSSLDLMEQFFIDALGTISPRGYNLRLGGGNGKHSPELIKKMEEIRARPEYRENIAAATRETMSKPDVKVRHKRAVKISHNQPEYKAAASIRATELHAKPEVKANHRAGCKRAGERPEVRERHRADTTEYWQRPGVKEEMSRIISAAQLRPEVREATSVRMKKARADPVLEAARNEALRETLAKPEVKARKSEIMKELHARPGMTEMMHIRAKEALKRPDVISRISAATKGSRWINNGEKNYRLKPSLDLPAGWSFGIKWKKRP